MKVKYVGESDPLELLNGKIYDVIEIDEVSGWYRIVDETGEDYLYPAEDFEIVEETVTETEIKLVKMLIKIDNDQNAVIGAALLARETKMTEECISFIEENPNVTYDDIINFMLDDDCFENITE